MPAIGFLKLEQKQHLQQLLKQSDRSEMRERVLILLLMNDGRTQEEIAALIGCSRRTVAYWCVHGDPDTIESLEDGRRKREYRKVNQVYIDKLLEIVEEEPSELGYEFGRWTAERLSTYLEKETGLKISSSQVRKILKRKKYAYLWAKYSLEDRQNTEKRKEFKEKFQNYLSIVKENPKLYQIWFWDESGFSLRVLRRKTWGKKGKRKKVTGKRSRGRVNMMGGLRLSDKKRVCYFIEKGNSETFYEQLKQLHEFVLKEWLTLGNSQECFYKYGPKIIIFLDNASYHKRKDICAEIEKNLPNIILEYLSAYSPDFNLIELVWHSCKEYIAHRLFQSVCELKSTLNKLLNDGELIIKWGRKIKNKGNAVCAN